MSDKISALTAYVTPITTDVIPIVDVTTSETKKITVDNLLKATCTQPLVYKAYLTQAGAAAPTAVEVINTIGAIVWARSGVGIYTATLAGAFTVGQTFLMLGGENIVWGVSAPSVYTVLTSVNVCTISSHLAGAVADDVITGMSILIEVYP